MKQRGGVGKFFIFFFLCLILLLQLQQLRKYRRFCRQLERVEENLANCIHPSDSNFGLRSRSKASPDEGDWLVWAFRVEPKTLNQFSAENDIYSRWITVPYIFEPLLVYDFNDLTMQPWLAESFHISEDGLRITFKLRDDVHFSDGHPVTAEDVIFTYQTAVNPGVDAANIANLFTEVEKAVAEDQRTVTFYLRHPYFKALENLSFWDFGILPEHIYRFDDPEQFNRRVSDPVGSGPFVFEKWETGKQIVLRRNENYWGEKPKLRKIVYRFITNAVAAVQALRSHQVDIIIPEPDQFAELSRDPAIKKEFYCLEYWAPGTPFYYIGYNQDTPFFKDRLVRLAMTHLLDRNLIISRLLKGHGRAVTGPFYINGPQYDHSIEHWPYDPNKAAQLLDQAGWKDSDGDGLRDKDNIPFRFKFMYASDRVLYQRLAKLLKDQAAKVGIEVIPEPLEWSVLITRLTNRQFDATVMGWGGDILEDPYQLWHSSQIGNRGSNYVGFRNAEADALIELARRTLDEDKRNRLYHRLHRILHDQQPYTFLYARPTFRIVDRRFRNVKVYKLGLKYWQWYVPRQEQRYR